MANEASNQGSIPISENKMKLNRSILFLLAVGWCGIVNAESAWDQASAESVVATEITVHRSPSCGCCGIWLDHLKKQGFVVNDIKTQDVNLVKQQYGVGAGLASCHTALVEGYVIEGHVPAADIRKMLAEKPNIVGLSVPGMPQGTPGMEMSGRKQPFAVISFDKNGNQENYTEYLFY
jgi:hypothetical protein